MAREDYNRSSPRAAQNVPPEVVRPPPNQQQLPKANDKEEEQESSPPLPATSSGTNEEETPQVVPRECHGVSFARAVEPGRVAARCQPRSPRRETIPIRPHTSSSPLSRRESTRRNPTMQRRRAGCPTRRRATFSARSKPLRVKSSASACLAARCVLRDGTLTPFSLARSTSRVIVKWRRAVWNVMADENILGKL